MVSDHKHVIPDHMAPLVQSTRTFRVKTNFRISGSGRSTIVDRSLFRHGNNPGAHCAVATNRFQSAPAPNAVPHVVADRDTESDWEVHWHQLSSPEEEVVQEANGAADEAV